MNNEFKEYWDSLTREEQESLAKKADTSAEYLYQVATGRRKPGWKTCLNLETATGGLFKKKDLRPDIFGGSSTKEQAA